MGRAFRNVLGLVCIIPIVSAGCPFAKMFGAQLEPTHRVSKPAGEGSELCSGFQPTDDWEGQGIAATNTSDPLVRMNIVRVLDHDDPRGVARTRKMSTARLNIVASHDGRRGSERSIRAREKFCAPTCSSCWSPITLFC